MKKLIFICYIFLLPFTLACSETTPEEDEFSHIKYASFRIDSLKNILQTQTLTKKHQFDIYTEIASNYSMFSIDSTKVYATPALFLAHKLKEYDKLIPIYSSLSIAYCFAGEYDSAIVYMDRMRETAIKLERKEEEIYSISLTAVIYAKQGKYNTAIDLFHKALKMAEEIGYTECSVMTLLNLSEIYRRLGDPTTAIKYLKQAEMSCTLLEEGRSLWRKHHIYNEYAFNYLNSGNLDEALQYVLKAESLNRGQINMCYTKGLLATIYLKLNDYDRALKYADESYLWANSLNDKNLYAYSGKILSDVYLALKRYHEAETAAIKVWAADSTNLDESRVVLENIVLANIYMGNTEKAVQYLKKYSELNTQYSEKSFQTTISDLAIKYETEKKDIRIAALEKDRKLYAIIIASGLIVLLLVLGVLFFLHRLNREKHKMAEQQVKQLEQEKQLVAAQAVLDGEAAERSRLSRDLHDGLGGMLSVVKLNLKNMKLHAVMDNSDIEHFDKAIVMLDQSIGELRRVAHHIMPESLMRYGLKVSLEDFCRAIQGAQFQYLGEDPRLENHLEVLIYRCAYELVNNAVKHAQATSINVQLMIDNGVVSLTVLDNGIGFDPQVTNFGIGLENIRTRISAYNGKMTILSSPESGTEVCIEIELL